jgi:hypothetical protein
MSESRAELRRLVDVLPTRKIKQARSYLRFLLEDEEEDAILMRVADDELSVEDRSDIAAAQVEASAGRAIPWGDAKKALRL